MATTETPYHLTIVAPFLREALQQHNAAVPVLHSHLLPGGMGTDSVIDNMYPLCTNRARAT
jgi:hypothetical protein